MIAFAGGAILYDTSNVLHHYPQDRHVAAALSLFASVALDVLVCSPVISYLETKAHTFVRSEKGGLFQFWRAAFVIVAAVTLAWAKSNINNVGKQSNYSSLTVMSPFALSLCFASLFDSSD